MTVPELAIIGHPNEGKSSVLSTLAEDDSVRISPIPGETTECRSFPVIIDGQEMLRFTDTPGFQNPTRVLSLLKKLTREGDDLLSLFQAQTRDIPELQDDRELLTPLLRGAGILYVVDGSRPVRNVDRAEMEILRLTGKPRMAILNCKEDAETHVEAWKKEFRLRFNSHWRFNAHRATYAERILLIEALGAIDQDWQPRLATIASALRKDWQARLENSTDILVDLIESTMSFELTTSIGKAEEKSVQKKLIEKYRAELRKKESQAHEQIRKLFKHNIYRYNLPPESILQEELFGKRTWQLLGLRRRQVLIIGGLGGAAIGVGLDVATLGHSLGLFATVGGLAGAVTAFFGGRNLSGQSAFLGIPLGTEEMKVGPPQHIDLLFILVNRGLLYFAHTINQAHGKRDSASSGLGHQLQHSYTANWSASALRNCHNFHQSLTSSIPRNRPDVRKQFRALILENLQQIARGELAQRAPAP